MRTGAARAAKHSVTPRFMFGAPRLGSAQLPGKHPTKRLFLRVPWHARALLALGLSARMEVDEVEASVRLDWAVHPARILNERHIVESPRQLASRPARAPGSIVPSSPGILQYIGIWLDARAYSRGRRRAPWTRTPSAPSRTARISPRRRRSPAAPRGHACPRGNGERERRALLGWPTSGGAALTSFHPVSSS